MENGCILSMKASLRGYGWSRGMKTVSRCGNGLHENCTFSRKNRSSGFSLRTFHLAAISNLTLKRQTKDQSLLAFLWQPVTSFIQCFLMTCRSVAPMCHKGSTHFWLSSCIFKGPTSNLTGIQQGLYYPRHLDSPPDLESCAMPQGQPYCQNISRKSSAELLKTVCSLNSCIENRHYGKYGYISELYLSSTIKR